MRPHYWLPDTTKYGERPACVNCANFDECGAVGYICGAWVEEEERQIAMELEESND